MGTLQRVIMRALYLTPPTVSHIIERNGSKYNLSTKNKLTKLTRFNTYFMKHSITHRGSILWNPLSVSCNGDKWSPAVGYQFTKCTDVL